MTSSCNSEYPQTNFSRFIGNAPLINHQKQLFWCSDIDEKV